MSDNKKKLKVVSAEETKLDLKRRDTKVYELRIQGNTYDQIASEVGFSGPSGAWQAYERIKNEMIFEPADEARNLELVRLDEMQFAIWDRAIKGEISAVTCVLKIMDSRAKLLGLDRPDKIEVSKWDFSGGNPDIEVRKIVNAINEREDQFMARREAEVRKEMRSQFEVEKRLEKSLTSKQNTENAKASLMALLDDVRKRQNNEDWKLNMDE